MRLTGTILPVPARQCKQKNRADTKKVTVFADRVTLWRLVRAPDDCCNKRTASSDIYTDGDSPGAGSSVRVICAWDRWKDFARTRLQTYDWQVVVEEYGPLVWRTAYRLLANHADAADCFQDAFLTALEISRRQPVQNLPGLLTRLATTRAIDRLRQKGRRDRRQASAYDRDRAIDSVDPLDQLEAQDLAGQLRKAIGELPPQEAKVFCLRHLSHLSYRQIARELQIGINVVGVSLHRAKSRLRAALRAADMDHEVTHEERQRCSGGGPRPA